MKSLQQATGLKGKKVLVRSDLNVPIVGNKVRDGFRIDKALATIKFLQKKGAKVIVISHTDADDEHGSLLAVSQYLKKKKVAHTFVPFVVGEKVIDAVEHMGNGEIVLLENLRQEEGEKSNSQIFTLSLSALADIYVNDAFPVSHRAHASIVSLPKVLPSYVGLQFEQEIKNLSLALKPAHPFMFILGGAKISTKLPLLKKFIKLADHVFVGGTIMNTVLRDQKHEIGISVADETEAPTAITKSKKLLGVEDVIVQAGTSSKSVTIKEVSKKDKIVDVGLKTIALLAPIIKKSKLIVWNGPMGYYEGGYDKATIALLKLLASAKATTIIGGGDTAALVSKMNMEKKFTFVSTGGGAALDFLANGTLPGIKALNSSKK